MYGLLVLCGMSLDYASGQISHGTASIVILSDGYTVLATDSLEQMGSKTTLGVCKVAVTDYSILTTAGIGAIGDVTFDDLFKENSEFTRRVTPHEFRSAVALWAEQVRSILEHEAKTDPRTWQSLPSYNQSTFAVVDGLTSTGPPIGFVVKVQPDRSRNPHYPFLTTSIAPIVTPDSLKLGGAAYFTYAELKDHKTDRARRSTLRVDQIDRPRDLAAAIASARSFILLAEAWFPKEAGGEVLSYHLSSIASGWDSGEHICNPKH
jgi:hypothetical protein